MTIPIHHLWSKAVGTPEYFKQEWKDLEKAIEVLESSERRALARSDRLQEAGSILANFAITAPGRLPEAVQDAVTFVREGRGR